MAEYPVDRSTLPDLSWATAGIKTPSTAGQKADGFVQGDIPGEDVVNYRWDGLDQHLVDYSEDVRPRAFDDFVEAIDATSANDPIVWAGEQSWGDSEVTKTTAGTVTCLATDARRVYYCVAGVLYAATADATTDADVEWSRDIASLDSLTANRLATDGNVVLAWNTGGGVFRVYDAAAGGAPVGSGTLPGAIRGAAADSDSADSRCWFSYYNAGGTSAQIYRWTIGAGLVLMTGASRTANGVVTDSLTVTRGNVLHAYSLAGGGYEILWMGKAAALGSADRVDAFSSTAAAAFLALASRGDQACYAIRSNANLVTVTNGRTSAAPASIQGASAALELTWGDGLLITRETATAADRMRVYDERMFPVYEREPSLEQAALAGQSIWGIDSGDLIAIPVGLPRGCLWARRSDGTDGNYDWRASSEMRLITRTLG